MEQNNKIIFNHSKYIQKANQIKSFLRKEITRKGIASTVCFSLVVLVLVSTIMIVLFAY